MKKWLFWTSVVVVVIALLWLPTSALAAPGGKIVSGFFKTPVGKIIGVALAIILLPLIIYIKIKEMIAEKRAMKALRRLAEVDKNFDWMKLRDRVTDCYLRVHAAWSAEDMSEASEWMTSWYWQNQQLAFLRQWERDGLVNHCRIKQIKDIRLLFVKFEQAEDASYDGSRVVISITSNMEDYLAERESGKIVEGAKGYEDTEHMWTFILQQGKWVVSNIEEGSMSLQYAKLLPEVPEVLPARKTTVAQT
jgi:predicted lipid-binding transport protein (Tim44 family)